MQVTKRDGMREELDISKIHDHVRWACEGIKGVSQSVIETSAHIMFYDGIQTEDIQKAIIKAAADQISIETPTYSYVAAKLLLQVIYKEVTGGGIEYPHLRDYVEYAVEINRLDERLLKFDLDALNAYIHPSRDYQFTYLGLQTIADRYLVRESVTSDGRRGQIIEMPQHFWMRVAMGLALREFDTNSDFTPEFWAIEFYNVLSRFEFISSTPTLFNSGTPHSQMSSCYLNTVSDSIWDSTGEPTIGTGIFGTITECALLSKFAGGIGTDWTRVRPAGSAIHSTNGTSSGVVPYLKLFNDTAVAVNQGGRRNGSFACYLEPWHADFMNFIDLKKQTGDHRRRAPDVFPAAWIPDLFMKRLKKAERNLLEGREEEVMWSFFGHPYHEQLHGTYGLEFEDLYHQLEDEGLYVEQKPVLEVWKMMITRLVETGAPWVTFKDECNRRQPQDHVGMVNSSNLCTEITLVTNDEETAVCNLGSLNLSRINTDTDFMRVIPIAVRMLDNVIDLNFYPSDKSAKSNLRHRPIGLGVMGLTELLVRNGIDWESDFNVQFQDQLFEKISYYAIMSSCRLAEERGPYPSFSGSKWDRGILPIDTARDQSSTMNWKLVRDMIKRSGMRNSNVMAIAPTATISNIAGTTPCIEPVFQKVTMKENKSGIFKVIDPTLEYGRPELCKESFDIDQQWIIKAAAARQKWIDQSQSVNLFKRQGLRGRELSEWYMLAWELGLKTTYYLRNQQKAETGGHLRGDNVADNSYKMEMAGLTFSEDADTEIVMCSITDPDCESCQ